MSWMPPVDPEYFRGFENEYDEPQNRNRGIIMTDAFSVTAAWNQTSYTAGQTITATISGGDVLTTTTTSAVNVGPITIPVIAADGAQSTVTLPAVPVTVTNTVATPESVVIDTSRAIVDSGTPPRTWVVSANKLSITATA
jgi:hypothetical protein